MKFLRRAFRGAVNKLGYDVHKIGIEVEHPIPWVSVAKILDGSKEIRILEPEGTNSNALFIDLVVLSTLVARLTPKTIFEIGTFDGRTMLNLAANMTDDAQAYTLDLPAESGRTPYERNLGSGEDSPLRYAKTRWASRIKTLTGDSREFDFTPYNGGMDFIFIDANHSYEAVKNDSKKAMLLASKRAVIVWHDYHRHFPGVVQCLDELYVSEGVFSGLRRIGQTSMVYLSLDHSI